MKKPLLIFLFLCLYSGAGFTAPFAVKPISLELNSVSVTDLAKLVFADMLKAPYFVAPDVVSDSRKISLSLHGQTQAQAFETIKLAFQAVGVDVKLTNNVYFLTRQPLHEKTEAADASPAASVDTSRQALDSLPVAAFVTPDSTDELLTYVPRFRSLLYLSKVAKFAGASVPDTGQDGGVLIYTAGEKFKERIDKALRSSDLLPPSVTIKAALIEYTQSSDKGFSVAVDVISKRLGLAVRAGNLLANTLTLRGASISAVLSAIEGDSNFHYMAQPTVQVQDGENAVLSVGQEVPVRASVSVDKLGNPVQSITYRPSGVVLNVTPHITADSVTLKVDQQVSSFSNTTTSNIDSPTMLKRSVVTTVTTKQGQLVVLAGLDDDKKNETSQGLPFLPDFMRSRSAQTSKSQILLMLEILPTEI